MGSLINPGQGSELLKNGIELCIHGAASEIGNRHKDRIGFPVGITVKKEGPWAFDLEFVPSINDHDVELTVHPGVLYAIDENWTAGLRMGFDIQQSLWGFTPLINRRLYDLTENSHLFIELPVPIRIKEDNSATVTVALHLGISF